MTNIDLQFGTRDEAEYVLQYYIGRNDYSLQWAPQNLTDSSAQKSKYQDLFLTAKLRIIRKKLAPHGHQILSMM